jgi:hypothetical protein
MRDRDSTGHPEYRYLLCVSWFVSHEITRDATLEENDYVQQADEASKRKYSLVNRLCDRGTMSRLDLFTPNSPSSTASPSASCEALLRFDMWYIVSAIMPMVEFPEHMLVLCQEEGYSWEASHLMLVGENQCNLEFPYTSRSRTDSRGLFQ